ncbi:MAG: transporter substrate-binding protein [Paenibacillus sp.]|jgi:multiple sugar transport system substrate-binding protein|nr:transporter substrate-binding protein [Paenibacillus sp.]
MKSTDMKTRLAILVSLTIAIASGCSNGDQPAATDSAAPAESKPAVPTAMEATKEPIELTVYYPFSDGTAESFQDRLWKHVQKKYPNFKVKWLNTASLKLADLAATKTPVDLFWTNANSAAQFADLGYVTDMTDMIKQNKYDLNRIEQVTLDIIKKASNGKQTALPIYANSHLLFYNKDIFDKFGVAYPKNGMTWDDTYELTKKVTRLENGVQYVGFEYQFISGTANLLNQYGQEEMDPQSKKVLFDSGRWPDIMRNFLRFYQIPGNEYLTSQDIFPKEQRIAMMVTLSNRVSGNPEWVPPNWDIASMPVYADAKGIGSGYEPLYLYLSSVSKYKNEAYLAITALESDEVQSALLLENGYFPVAKLPDIKSLFAQVPSLKGKNIDALFVNKPAPAITLTQDVLAVHPSLSAAVTSIMKGEKDINSALREATEAGNKKIEERKAAGLTK